MPKPRVKARVKAEAWYPVYAPPAFGEVELPAVVSDDPSKLIGSGVEATLYDITGDYSHINIKLRFQIVRVEGGKAYTEFKGEEYLGDYLRSLVRRGSSKVDSIFDVETRDGYKLRIFLLCCTAKRISRSQAKAIRSIGRRIMVEKASTLNFTQFVQEAVLSKLASDVYNEAKKIAPLRHVGIRKIKVLTKLVEKAEEVEAVAEAQNS
ncbi:MAG: 30S ribosomal protein S3ae [Nitrososphaerota archaeon]|nr:30S ribosomal protein S3ae [Candidatus Bathyarchaeota archaeon]MDW8061170.1 30S ribosomal protein S3ae [Nitrososphaerota archaeon]